MHDNDLFLNPLAVTIYPQSIDPVPNLSQINLMAAGKTCCEYFRTHSIIQSSGAFLKAGIFNEQFIVRRIGKGPEVVI